MRQDARQPVFRQILAQAERFPDKAALITGGQTTSYAELAASVADVAATLRHRFSVRTGDRVALQANSHSGFVSAYLAVHSIGGICVPLDPQTVGSRFKDIVERVSPRLIAAESPGKHAGMAVAGFHQLASLDQNLTPEPFASLDLEQDADVLFTTGTTGRSKGVALSHRALAAACAHINAFIGTGPDAVEVLPLPLSHSFGLGRLRCVLSVGGTLILLPGFVGSGPVHTAITKFKATGFASVPAGIALLLHDGGAALAKHGKQLQYIEIGSSAMPLAQMQLLMKTLPGTRICMHYGLTEASRSAYLSFHDDANRLDSIGRPSPGVEMRIVDDHKHEVDAGVVGGIEIRGDHLMSRYWDDPGLTDKTLRNGWLQTGDLGRRGANGYFYLTSRASEIINVGGRKVSPLEIEEILKSHPAIADCACIGVPDAQNLTGEMVSAFLVADPSVDSRPKFSELAKLLRQSLEPYKIPRRFAWIDEIPKSPSGKVLRRQLKPVE